MFQLEENHTKEMKWDSKWSVFILHTAANQNKHKEVNKQDKEPKSFHPGQRRNCCPGGVFSIVPITKTVTL